MVSTLAMMGGWYWSYRTCVYAYFEIYMEAWVHLWKQG